jgi:hypothetical protein
MKFWLCICLLSFAAADSVEDQAASVSGELLSLLPSTDDVTSSLPSIEDVVGGDDLVPLLSVIKIPHTESTTAGVQYIQETTPLVIGLDAPISSDLAADEVAATTAAEAPILVISQKNQNNVSLPEATLISDYNNDENATLQLAHWESPINDTDSLYLDETDPSPNPHVNIVQKEKQHKIQKHVNSSGGNVRSRSFKSDKARRAKK